MMVIAQESKPMQAAQSPSAPLGHPRLRQFAETSDWFKGFIFGEQGSGKTTLAATISAGFPRVLWLNAEEGLSVLTAEQRRKAVIWDAKSWDDAEEFLRWLETEGQEQFQAVVVDTITEVGVLLKKAILAQPTTGPKRVHPETLGEAEYDLFAERMLEWLRRFRPLRCHVVFTAQVKDLEEDEPRGNDVIHIITRVPSFGAGKKTSFEAPGLFDFVGYLGVATLDGRRTQRRLLLQPVNRRRAKIRVPGGVFVPIDVAIGTPVTDEMIRLIHLMKTGENLFETGTEAKAKEKNG